MNMEELKKIIEAALMVTDEPLSLDRLEALFDLGLGAVPEHEAVRAAVESLQQDYAGHGIELKQVASGWRFQARAEYAPWINRLWEERAPRYSRALLETLAIIAYRQPITRGEIEDIRGVSLAPSILKTLTEREWVRVAGYRDVPGRPAVYATTREFLDYFNLKSLSDLPELSELRDIEDINLDLFRELPASSADGTGAANEAERVPAMASIPEADDGTRENSAQAAEAAE
ncbi:MAG TPA: SMC-Scp complex subunit ScpB [Gammaproteobacteria bacterium]|nr:SMC-Scp complex subunit ScpB [Gammaproteobacteria bacterium]